MYLIIDTYNVLQTTGILPPDLAGVEVDGLARLILGSRYHRRRSLLVCDGASRSASALGSEAQVLGLPARVPGHAPESGDLESAVPRIGVHYAGPGRDADSVIHGLIRASSSPARLTIVSTDREIRRHAIRRRARSIVSELFLEHLAVDFREYRLGTGQGGLVYEVPLDTGSIDWWLQFFRMDDLERDRLDELLGPGNKRRPHHDQPESDGGTDSDPSGRTPPAQRHGKPEWWSKSDDEQDEIDIDVDSIDTGDFLD
ncbi:MAG: hypothetical protein D8M59_00725 [Planctomycetes bacterium]|nr:hypothetical protein [Planctomycetota bacterium]NOG54754.1 hypothetical protein [Planctomycetota bacterium]